jgi:hypothetical protein
VFIAYAMTLMKQEREKEGKPESINSNREGKWLHFWQKESLDATFHIRQACPFGQYTEGNIALPKSLSSC